MIKVFKIKKVTKQSTGIPYAAQIIFQNKSETKTLKKYKSWKNYSLDNPHYKKE